MRNQGPFAVETDSERIKSLAETSEDESWRFRAYLKGLDLSEAALESYTRSPQLHG
jgi:hypothetical protein